MFLLLKMNLYPTKTVKKIPYRSTWTTDSKIQYQNSFVESDIMQLSECILSQQISANPTKNEIDQLVSDLTSVIVNPAKQVGLCKKNISKKVKRRKSPNQSWFNSECENRRKKFFKAKNAVKSAKTKEEKDRRKAEMDQEGKEYKQFISANHNAFTRGLHKNLRELHRHNPKEYWSILKNSDSTKKSEPKVTMADFEKHFNNLNKQDSSDTPTHEFDPCDIDLSTIQEFNLEFTVDEVLENIKALKNNKSEGGTMLKMNT